MKVIFSCCTDTGKVRTHNISPELICTVCNVIMLAESKLARINFQTVTSRYVNVQVFALMVNLEKQEKEGRRGRSKNRSWRGRL